MIILASFWNAFGLALLFTFIGLVVGVLTVWLSNLTTGGKGILYKMVNDYGFDDWRTLDALKVVLEKRLRNDGYFITALFIGHTVGNSFKGTFYDDESRVHDIEVITNGYDVSYSVDNGYMHD